MNVKPIIITLLLLVLCSACRQSDDYFIGKWQIVHVVENDAAIALEDNFMHVKRNGTFNSYDGSLNKHETGTWAYRDDKKILIIDGEDDDSKWKLSLRNDTLFFHALSGNLYLIAKEINK